MCGIWSNIEPMPMTSKDEGQLRPGVKGPHVPTSFSESGVVSPGKVSQKRRLSG